MDGFEESLDEGNYDIDNYFIPDQPDSFDKGSFKGSALIFPVVSLGNVPQLAVDLLIFGDLNNDENVKEGERFGRLGEIKRIGSLDPIDHIPVVSSIDKAFIKKDQKSRNSKVDEINQDLNQISTPVEVYQTADKLFTIVQQRSPVIKALKDSHVKKLRSWVLRSNFSSILLLVSIDSATRSDSQLKHSQSSLSSSPFYYFSLDNDQSLGDRTRVRNNLTSQVDSIFHPELTGVNSRKFYDEDLPPILSAGGLGRRILIEFQNHQRTQIKKSSSEDTHNQGSKIEVEKDSKIGGNHVEVNSLLMYVSEGDNRFDAIKLSKVVLRTMLLPTHHNSTNERNNGNYFVEENELAIEPLSWHLSNLSNSDESFLKDRIIFG